MRSAATNGKLQASPSLRKKLGMPSGSNNRKLVRGTTLLYRQ